MEQQQIIHQLEKGKDPKLLWQCPAASESSCELPAGEMQPHACATSGNLVCEGNTGIFILPALPKGHRQLHRRDAAHPVNTQRFGSRIPGKTAGHRASHLQRAQHQHPLPAAANWAKFIQEWREKEIKDKPGIPEEETSQPQNSDVHQLSA